MATLGDCLLYPLFIVGLWRRLRCEPLILQSRTYRYGHVPKVSSVDMQILQQQLKEKEIHTHLSFPSCFVILKNCQKCINEVKRSLSVSHTKFTSRQRRAGWASCSSQLHVCKRPGKWQLFRNYRTDHIHILSKLEDHNTWGFHSGKLGM